MLKAKAISLRATVINARTVREAGESVRENEGNLVLEAQMTRSGPVGKVLAIQGRIAAKEGGDLVQGVSGDLIRGVNGDLDLGLSLGDTTAEVDVREAIQGASPDHPNGPDQEDPGEPGIMTLMLPSKNEITRCWTTFRSKTLCSLQLKLLRPPSKKRTTYPYPSSRRFKLLYHHDRLLLLLR